MFWEKKWGTLFLTLACENNVLRTASANKGEPGRQMGQFVVQNDSDAICELMIEECERPVAQRQTFDLRQTSRRQRSIEGGKRIHPGVRLTQGAQPPSKPAAPPQPALLVGEPLG